MHMNYQDAMAVVRRYGKPDYFITFTASPAWPEISENLPPGEHAVNRPDLVARVFHLKLKALLKMLIVPLVLSSIVTGVAGVGTMKDLRRRSKRERRLAESVAMLQRTFGRGVRGRLIDLVQPTARRYHVATSMAMGRHMDAVVVDKESVGFECLQYLRDQHLGVVTVLPLDTLRPKPVNERLRQLDAGT